MAGPSVPAMVGQQVPEAWQGEVRGVFEHAVGVALAGEDSLISLLDGARNMSERSVALSPDQFDALRRALTRKTSKSPRDETRGGPVVGCERGVLDCGSLRFDLSAAPRWHTPDLVARTPASGRLLRRAREALGPAAHPPPWEGAVFRRFDLWVAEAGELGEVVGAGPGLTPAGDDMLTGFLCGLHAARAYSAEASRRLKMLREELPPLLGRTDLTSRCFLRDALEGRFHRPLAGLCLAMHPGSAVRRAALRSLPGEERNMSAALDEALAFGAGSGREGAYGLFTALWLARPWRDAH